MAQGIARSNKTRDGLAAALAYNLGDLEEDQYQIRQEWLAQHAAFGDMQDALEQAGLRVLNRPNLLNQHWWTNGTGVEHPVVYGKDARISGTSYPYLTSYNNPTETTQTTAPTAEQKAAATSIWSVTEEGVTTYHIWTDEDDIQATVASLAAADQISETDGETYDKAIQFDITANSAYGNMEWLLYCNPYNTRVYDQGTAVVRNYGQIEEMQPGHRYSLSCWVRVLSGDGAWMKMGYGNSFTNQPYNDTTNQRSGVSDWIKIDPLNGAWQRISWTFDFNPAGDWYGETSAVVDGVTKITRTYNWYKKVGFGVGRKFTAQVQVCGFRLVEGRTYVTDTYDDLEEDVNSGKDRLTALEAAVPAAKAAVLGIVAESDTATATANHVVGALFVMGDVLYKTTAAIAIGETITPGTNCDTTTLAAEIEAAAASVPDLSGYATTTALADYAPKANPEFSGSIGLSRKSGTTVGVNSMAIGTDTEASGFCSQAVGYNTIANGYCQNVSGVYNRSDREIELHDDTKTYESGYCVYTTYHYREDNTWWYGKKVFICKAYHSGDTPGTYGDLPSSHWDLVYNAGEQTGSYPTLPFNTAHVEIVGIGRSNYLKNGRTLDWSGNEEIAGAFKCQNKITIGNTTITESQLQSLLALLS